MVKHVESTKLFYKKYPYKIAYKRLYGFPSKEIVDSYTDRTGYGWWFDYPVTPEDIIARSNCIRFLRSKPGTKFANSSMTHVYFEDKDVFELATTRYRNLQQEIHIPFIDNLSETLDAQQDNIEIKNNLYYKKFRYKISLKYNNNLHVSLGPLLVDTYSNNDNYLLNTNVRRFAKEDVTIPLNSTNYRYKFRHSVYNSYTIYCREYIDLQLMAFVASENITKITKAILRHEIDAIW